VRSAVGATSSTSFHGSPGRVLTGAALVRNLTLRPVTVMLQPAEIRNASNGNADYVTSRQALPITIHLPGRLSRSLALRWLKLVVALIGAGLVLGLLPRGSELTEQAQVKLRVLRGTHRVFVYASTLGQLFPGGGLNYRIPWPGRPKQGAYHVLGTTRPRAPRSPISTKRSGSRAPSPPG
jgi:hypothetical protein